MKSKKILEIKRNVLSAMRKSDDMRIATLAGKWEHRRANRSYSDFVERMSEIDSIADFDVFKKMIKQALARKQQFAYEGCSDDTQHYGYYASLVEFAKVKELHYPSSLYMEHGVFFGGGISEERFHTNAFCFLSMNEGGRKKVHQHHSDRLYFSVGPYIHYAKKYYGEEQEKRLKEKLGRTLLVFPFHTCEGEEVRGGEDGFLRIVYEKYAERFDSIVVCAYWYDVGEAIFDEYSKRGARIVSAGFRGDQNFVRRLKTIISLCDAVVVDDIGTNLGFCVHMGKPVYYEQAVGHREADEEVGQKNMDRFYEAFHTDAFDFTESQKKLQEELYEQFWGGSRLRSEEEMRAILSVMKRVIKRAYYSQRTERIDRAVRACFRGLKRRKDFTSRVEYRIMAEALEK